MNVGLDRDFGLAGIDAAGYCNAWCGVRYSKHRHIATMFSKVPTGQHKWRSSGADHSPKRRHHEFQMDRHEGLMHYQREDGLGFVLWHHVLGLRWECSRRSCYCTSRRFEEWWESPSSCDIVLLQIIFCFVSVKLPEVKFDIETDNYNVFEDIRTPLNLKEAAPVATTCIVFDEYVQE